MQLSKYKESFSNLKKENRFGNLMVVGLVGVLFVQSCFLFSKDTVVVMQPWTMTQDAELSSTRASRTYQEAWALALAEMLGNITPDSIDFVLDRLKPLLSPKIYNEVIRNAQEQAIYLKEDRITQVFEPRTVEFEKTTGKVFVHGYSYITGASLGTGNKDNKPLRNELTFEFRIKIAQYIPIVEDIAVYSGQARTTKVLNRLEKAKKRADEKAAKKAQEEES